MTGASDNSSRSTKAPIVHASIPEFRYGSRIALRSIELEISEPGVIALVGPNGSGKSTLLRIAAGLVGGRGIDVRIHGRSIRDLPERLRAAWVAWVPQRAAPVFSMNLTEMVRVGLYRHNHLFDKGLSDGAAIQESLRAVELEELADRDVETLSGGEWQRALLARALVQRTPVLLLDEPVAGLDLHHQEEAYQLFRRLAADGKLVIVADHHIELAASHSDRIVMLSRGSIVGDGPPREVLTRDRIERAFGVLVEVFDDPVTGGPRLSRPRRNR